MNNNNSDTQAVAVSSDQSQSPSGVWVKPTLEHLSIKEALTGPNAGDDGLSAGS